MQDRRNFFSGYDFRTGEHLRFAATLASRSSIILSASSLMRSHCEDTASADNGKVRWDTNGRIDESVRSGARTIRELK